MGLHTFSTKDSYNFAPQTGTQLAFPGGGGVGPAPAPTITGFLPMQGAQGSTVVLSGTNFLGATLVSISSGAVASFTVDSATQITAVLSGSQVTGKVRVTTPAGTGVSSADFTVTTAGPGYVSYAPADEHWQDGTYRQAQPTGLGIVRNSYCSVEGTTSATLLRLTVNSQYNTLGKPTRVVGLYVNGAFQQVRFAVNSTSSQVIALPAGSKTLKIVMPDVARATVGQVTITGDALVDVEANGAITWQVPAAPARRVIFAGDSIENGGGATEPFLEAHAVLVRNALAQSAAPARLTVDAFSGGSLQDVYGPQADRTAYRERIYAQADGTVSTDVIHFYGVNDCGRNASTGAQYASNYAALLDDMHSERPDLNQYVVTPFTVNVNGQPAVANLENDYRAPLRQVLAARPWAILKEGPGMLSLRNVSGDYIHPTTAGHAEIAGYELTMLGSTVPNLSFVQVMEVDANGGATTLLKLTSNLSDPEFSFNGSPWQTSNVFNVRATPRGDYPIGVRSQGAPSRTQTQQIRVGQTYFVTDPRFVFSPNWNPSTPTESPLVLPHPGANDAAHYVEFAYDGRFEVWNRIQPNVAGMRMQKQDGAPGSTPFSVSVPTGNPSYGPSIGLTWTQPYEGTNNIMRFWGDNGDPDWYFAFIILY